MKQKKIILLFFNFVVLISLITIVFIIRKNNELNKFKNYPREIPEFSFQNATQDHFTKDSLNKKHKTVFIFFMYGCFNCLLMFEYFLPLVDEMSEIQFIFTTTEKYENIINYPEIKMYEGKQNVRFFGESNEFFKTFRVSVIPTVFFYSEQHILIGKYESEIQFHKLKKFIKDKK